MKILSDIEALKRIEGDLDLAIGVFDGVHLGHEAVVASAVAGGGVPVVVTFDPHPIQLLRPDKAPPVLTLMSQKARLLGERGVRYLLPVTFDTARAEQSAEAFVRELADSGATKSISVGAGFRFGHGRAGDVALLQELGPKLGFVAHGIDPVCDEEGELISSTRIRAAIDNGDLALASRLLGRDYSITAVVEQGQQLGRTIGFPTANLCDLPGQMPPHGVYSVTADIEGTTHQGIANLGVRPTVGGEATPLLEVHLFDFDREIYGELATVSFRSFVRPEQKFDGIEALKAQIAKDVAAVRGA
jgi:riboflavin kinase/FMN adenylyltransferase